MPAGFVTAVRTLSLIPIPGRDAEKMSTSLPWFPVVGALLGTGLVLAGEAFQRLGMGDWPFGGAFLLVLLSAALTRGLHLDGLADAAGAFFSMTGRDRMLAIMKDSRVGTFGVLALVFVIGIKWLAIERLMEKGLIIWILPAFVISRAVMADLSVSLGYARKEGGTGAPFVNGSRPGHRIGAWAISLVLLLAIGPFAPGALVIGVVLARSLALFFEKRIGGITGDLLGASSEITEAVLLMVGAMVAGRGDVLVGWKMLPW